MNQVVENTFAVAHFAARAAATEYDGFAELQHARDDFARVAHTGEGMDADSQVIVAVRDGEDFFVPEEADHTFVLDGPVVQLDEVAAFDPAREPDEPHVGHVDVRNDDGGEVGQAPAHGAIGAVAERSLLLALFLGGGLAHALLSRTGL